MKVWCWKTCMRLFYTKPVESPHKFLPHLHVSCRIRQVLCRITHASFPTPNFHVDISSFFVELWRIVVNLPKLYMKRFHLGCRILQHFHVELKFFGFIWVISDSTCIYHCLPIWKKYLLYMKKL